MKKRRTVRRFRPDPIPEDCIDKIIEVARWAPSGFHTQPWEFVVVKKKELKEAIVKALETYAPPITNSRSAEGSTTIPKASSRDAPVFILLLADWRAKAGLPGHPTEKSPLVTRTYYSSLASAFLYMHLAAASLGLASQWYSAASRHQRIPRAVDFPHPARANYRDNFIRPKFASISRVIFSILRSRLGTPKPPSGQAQIPDRWRASAG